MLSDQDQSKRRHPLVQFQQQVLSLYNCSINRSFKNLPPKIFLLLSLMLRIRFHLTLVLNFDFAVHSNTEASHLIGDQKTVSSPTAINTAELPYPSLDEHSGPPTFDPYHYPLLLDFQIFKYSMISDKV